ncbi:hypothetical protein Cylst_1182 [Cylindrospermum stagnale PCC 7417]|uniref:Uncharacterized protein n=1 Tax=Cylindrospermum stagnale PCC 7417 TaxID=56107 RepID=K9WUK4_9NOST|nr:hypothetical protein [Cylindrospermum stagnale]AFZ23484.1 hypothetical protein Cylst_1182 [Cylindrospermum stagnale PCC 7417]
MSLLRKVKKYYKWFWDEAFGGDYDAWGTSTYFMEIGIDLYANRQLEVYENGNVLSYDGSHHADNFGRLCDQRLGDGDIQEFEISKAEFEQVWQTKIPINRAII